VLKEALDMLRSGKSQEDIEKLYEENRRQLEAITENK
jgi:hypothetical protein